MIQLRSGGNGNCGPSAVAAMKKGCRAEKVRQQPNGNRMAGHQHGAHPGDATVSQRRQSRWRAGFPVRSGPGLSKALESTDPFHASEIAAGWKARAPFPGPMEAPSRCARGAGRGESPVATPNSVPDAPRHSASSRLCALCDLRGNSNRRFRDQPERRSDLPHGFIPPQTARDRLSSAASTKRVPRCFRWLGRGGRKSKSQANSGAISSGGQPGQQGGGGTPREDGTEGCNGSLHERLRGVAPRSAAQRTRARPTFNHTQQTPACELSLAFVSSF